MTREPKPSEITYKEKFNKNTQVSGFQIKEQIAQNRPNMFIKDRGFCEIDGKEKEFVTLTMYFDVKN